MKVCCQDIEKEITEWSERKTKNHSIVYDGYWRQYLIVYIDHSRNDQSLSYISYCPFCGVKLPSNLADKWYEVLESEYGITDPSGDEYDKVPSEFHTDEWWKKRGL